MPYYLLQASYTQEAWTALRKNPQDRTEGLRTLAERLGGKLHGLFFAFGEHDIVALAEMPNDQTAAALSLSAAAPGHLQGIKTTVLLTPDELIGALQQASTQTYQAPR
jgi:uncharacterized protein with GYD domain